MLAIVADFLSPYLAAVELSADLAGEVAAQSREIEEHRRFTGLIIDSLPVGLYVIDRDYRIQIWNRKRETGTQGLRRDDVVGRPVFEVLTRQPAGQLRRSSTGCSRPARSSRRSIEVDARRRAAVLPAEQDPDAARRRRDHPRHHDRRGRHRVAPVQAQILQSEKLAAIGQLAAGVMHEINNPLATISACVAAHRGAGARGHRRRRVDRRSTSRSSSARCQRCSRIVDGLLDFSRPKADRRKRRSRSTRLVEETLFLLKHHQRFKRLEVAARARRRTCPPRSGNAEQLIQVLMALMLNALDAMERRGPADRAHPAASRGATRTRS